MIKRKTAAVLAAAFILSFGSITVNTYGAFRDTGHNEYVITTKSPAGKTGKSLSVSFVVHNGFGMDLKNMAVRFSDNIDIDEEDDGTIKNGYIFPFETTDKIFEPKNVGSLKENHDKTVSIPARVRRDLKEGYYTVSIDVGTVDSSGGEKFFNTLATEYINVWVSQSASDDKDDDSTNDEVDFVLGEGQNTPFAEYPSILNYPVNIKNNSKLKVYDVTMSMIMSKDSAEFPLDINEGNYDRHFDSIEAGQTVSADYSMAIRKDAYSGFYPIKYKMKYRESSAGDLKEQERTFYVHIKNKEEKETTAEFSENTSTKARIIVDSFRTVPEKITAGEPFELIMNMKNASTSIPATNILLSLVSEKVTDGAVFTTSEGSSVVVDSLLAGQSKEVHFNMVSRAGVDQRSYSLTVKEQYDSPEYKNASQDVNIDLPVYQIARLNIGSMEITPEELTVGSETNVTFQINNTGKVMLYNVTAAFEADSIKPNECYVGNIKPGETGNVDIMLAGLQPTTDDGDILITVNYEDENGQVSSVEKTIKLYVSEEVPEEEYSEADSQAITEEQTKPNWTFYILLTIGLAVAAVITGFIIKKRKKVDKNEIS